MMHHSNCNIGNTSFSTIYQQSMTSFSYYNHVTSNPKTTNMQSTMEKSSYNNGQFHATDAGDPFNSHVNLQTNCLTRKRSSKKDRHSKINTARGPRDRRMRLSIDVAKKFFKLQDMLGFDKASNTVEWLLMKSKHAIRDLQPQQLNQSCSLKGALSSSSASASECEVMSLIDHSLAKETRAKARARARKRANEKRNIKFGCDGDGDGEGSDQCANLGAGLDKVVDRTTNRLEPSIPFGVQLTNGAEYPSSHFQFKQGVVDDNSSMISSNWSPHFQFKQGVVDDNSSMISSNWSPYFLFNYQSTLGPSQEHQFSDFEILGKPWDLGINN